MERRILQEYWRYYIHLEDLLIRTVDFVALTRDNFATYSNQYASILQLTGAELDAFFKYYVDPKGRCITDYTKCFIEKHSNLIRQEVKIKDSDILLMPFEKCEDVLQNKPIFWWKAFTNIKHNRIEKFSEANLSNCLNALAALYMLECQCVRDIAKIDGSIDILEPISRLFCLKDWNCNYIPSSKQYIVLSRNISVDGKTE